MTNIATKNGSVIVKDGRVAESCGCCGCARAWADAQEIEVALSFTSYRATGATRKTVGVNAFGTPGEQWTYVTYELCPSKLSGTFSLSRYQYNQTSPFNRRAWGMDLPNGMRIDALSSSFSSFSTPYLQLFVTNIPIAASWTVYLQNQQPNNVTPPSSGEMCAIDSSTQPSPGFDGWTFGQYPAGPFTSQGVISAHWRFPPESDPANLRYGGEIDFFCTGSGVFTARATELSGTDFPLSATVSFPQPFGVYAPLPLYPYGGSVDQILFNDSSLPVGNSYSNIATMTVESVNIIL